MRKTIRTALPLLLTAALLLSLAACGGSGSAGSTNGSGTAENQSGSQTAEVSEYTWNTTFQTIAEGRTATPYSVCYAEGRLLTVVYDKIGEDIPEGITPEYEGEYDIYGDLLYWINEDGSVEQLTGYTPMEAPETESEDDYSAAYTNSVFLGPDGQPRTLEYIYQQSYSGPTDLERYSDEWYAAGYYEYLTYSTTYYLRTLASDGSEVSCLDLNEVLDVDAILQETGNSDFYLYYTAMDGEGNIYLSTDTLLFILASDGTLKASSEFDNWIENLVRLKDGSVGAEYYGDDGECISRIDPETAQPGEPVSCGYIYNLISSAYADGYDFYYTSGSNLMGYDMASGQAVKIFNWLNCDIDTNNGGTGIIREDGSVLMLRSVWGSDYSTCDWELATVTQVLTSSLPQKTVLTFASQNVSDTARSAIISFNRSSSEYRIEVLDYSEYNTDEDYSAGLTKLNTEIMSGNVPDIIDLSGLDVNVLASKGLLLDLYPFIDSDSELSREDILPGIRAALEIDGCLYRTMSSFRLDCVIGAASVVGDTPGWTLDEFEEALAGMPDGCDAFNSYTTRSDILSEMLSLEYGNLVDRASGTCNIDSDLFREILAFAALFPEEVDWSNYGTYYEFDDDAQRISTGSQMLMRTTISDFDSFQVYCAMFGGDVTVIGYPVSVGVGNMISSGDSGCAISSSCKYPDAAWQMVRTCLTADYQEENVYEFPTNTEAMQAKLDKAMTPTYQKDADGNYLLDENGNRIEEYYSWYWGSTEIRIDALTQEEADKLMDAIDSAISSYDYDDEIMQIILEDTEAYFAGQKSADDVSRQLQSKLTIYLNEQM